jgi:hypothetical protein
MVVCLSSKVTKLRVETIKSLSTQAKTPYYHKKEGIFGEQK